MSFPKKRSNNKFKFELRILTRLRSLRNSKKQLAAALLIRQQLDVTQKHLLTFLNEKTAKPSKTIGFNIKLILK
jgi:hypothetical protein